MNYRFQLAVPCDAVRAQASAWLMLACASVAASSLFALLLVASRAPGLGTLFPGVDFYRLTLTMHVNTSQGIWFMAFAGALWTLRLGQRVGRINVVALALSITGAVLLVVSPLAGAREPVMSNYIPVLHHPMFLAGLALFGLGVGLQAASCALVLPRRTDGGEAALHLGLWCAAVTAVLALISFVLAGVMLPRGAEQYAFFEPLFWGGGHVWQFTLTLLMMVCWLWLAEQGGGRRPAPDTASRLFLLAALPTLAAPVIVLSYHPGSSPYREAFTQLMTWGGWIGALPLGVWLVTDPRSAWAARSHALALSVALFVIGLILGTAISGETTLVTAHYHGTIGAVTLAFMGATCALLPALGFAAPAPRLMRLQQWFYACGLLLMMLGLAWAGTIGAPRKMPGNVSLGSGYEAVARIVMGLGGTLAVAGILLFLLLVYRAFLSGVRHGRGGGSAVDPACPNGS